MVHHTGLVTNIDVALGNESLFVNLWPIKELKYIQDIKFTSILMDWKMINTIVPPSQLNIDYFGANERNALEYLRSVGTHKVQEKALSK